MANGVVRFQVEKTINGWQGTVTLPSREGAATTTVTAVGPTKQVALSRATGIARQVMNSPILKALLPPQAAFAIKAAGALAKAGPKIAKVAAKMLKSKPLRALAKLFG